MPSRRALLAFAAVLPASGLMLLACTSPPPPRPDFARIGFGHRSPLRFNVARVNFINEVRNSRQPPEVGHLFPDPPEQVVERWVEERLEPVGTEGELRAILREASVVETALPRTSGIRGLVTVDQSERYDGRLVLALRAFDGAGNPAGGVDARTERSITVPENLGRGERTATWHRLMETMARRLDEEMERAIRDSDLSRLLR